MKLIECRGECMSGYAPDLPIIPIGRCERQRFFMFCSQNRVNIVRMKADGKIKNIFNFYI